MQLFWLIFIATVYICNILFSSFSIIKYQQLEHLDSVPRNHWQLLMIFILIFMVNSLEISCPLIYNV